MATPNTMKLAEALQLCKLTKNTPLDAILAEFRENSKKIAKGNMAIVKFMMNVKIACITQPKKLPTPPPGIEAFSENFENVKNGDDVNIPVKNMNIFELLLLIMEIIDLSLTPEFESSCNGLKITLSGLAFNPDDVFMTCALEEFRRFLILHESMHPNYCAWAQKIQFRFDGKGCNQFFKMYEDLKAEVKINTNIHPKEPDYQKHW